MKKVIMLVVCMLLMTVSFAQALPQYYLEVTPGRTTSGGPFHITGDGMDFLTMCVESQEYVNVPGTYYGSLDALVWYSSGNSSTQALITDETKKLYSYFLDNPGLTNNQEGDIQRAIWDYQNQPGWDGTQGLNPFYVAAPGYAQTHPVMALNLWTNADGYDYNHRAQTMLAPVPIPAAVWLLGSGLIGLVGLRRRFKK